MAPRSKSTAPWAALLDSMKSELKGVANAQALKRRGAAEFADWADAQGFEVPFPAEAHEAALGNFANTLDVHKRADGTLNKQGEACLFMARELMNRSAATVQKTEISWADAVADIAQKHGAPALKTTNPDEEQTMAKRAEHETEEPETDEVEVDEDEEETEEEPEEEEAPAPRRRAPVQRVQVVERRPSRAPATRKAEGRSAAVKSILPRPEKIRLFKRNEMGKRELIEDFTVDEIGDLKLEAFIREYIDPEFGNPGADTEYIAYELDARTGQEKQPPSSITIRAQPAGPEPTDPFSSARKAMHMLTEMQGMMQPQQQMQQPSSVMEAAKATAVKGGDMQSMFMLMMMERMMQPQQQPQAGMQGELLLKIIDRLDKVERGGGSGGRSAGPEFGGGPGFGGFPMPPPFPYAPPAPAAPVHDSSSRLLDLAMAKLAAPPPSLADSVKELLALQSIMQPKQGESSEVAALRAELKAALTALSGGAKAPVGSLEEAMSTFEKMVTMQKAVATQVGGSSDVGGFFKSLITPEVAKAIAGVVGAAKPATPAPAPVPAPVVVAPPPPPRNFNQPPFPLPQAVTDAGKAFMMAQTPEVQAARFVDFVFAMFMTQDPYYVNLLTPALESLNRAEESVEMLKPARKLATQLIHEMRPPLASPEFVDACLAALAMKAGVDRLPETLVSTRGKWTFNGHDVVMQSNVAVPVAVTPPAQVIQFPSPPGGFPAVEPSKPREEREKELGYIEPVKSEPKSELPVNAAPVFVTPEKALVPINAQPVPPPASEQVIEVTPQRELVPVVAQPSSVNSQGESRS